MGFKEVIQELRRRGFGIVSMDGKEIITPRKFYNLCKKGLGFEDWLWNWNFRIFEKSSKLDAQLIGIPNRIEENTSATFWTIDLKELNV